MNNKGGAFIHIITPFILLFLCVGIFIIAMIKPSDKIKVYLNLAFMDDMKSNPLNDDTGLVIKENDIIEDYTGETSETGEVIHPSFGEQFAVISCDKADIYAPVYWGSKSELFERGACQASGSVLPGVDGNTVISAHVDTFFANLDKLEIGDTVTIKTNYGEFVYTVRELIEFPASNDKYLSAKNETILTLYTCKRDILGTSDTRIGAVCDITESKFYKEEE
ncbi:MAG: class D sortase [Ruminococcus sp.]|nr:class D sortase [Ruminococcus sp.]